jgi:hypothetical protein
MRSCTSEHVRLCWSVRLERQSPQHYSVTGTCAQNPEQGVHSQEVVSRVNALLVGMQLRLCSMVRSAFALVDMQVLFREHIQGESPQMPHGLGWVSNYLLTLNPARACNGRPLAAWLVGSTMWNLNIQVAKQFAYHVKTGAANIRNPQLMHVQPMIGPKLDCTSCQNWEDCTLLTLAPCVNQSFARPCDSVDIAHPAGKKSTRRPRSGWCSMLLAMSNSPPGSTKANTC